MGARAPREHACTSRRLDPRAGDCACGRVARSRVAAAQTSVARAGREQCDDGGDDDTGSDIDTVGTWYARVCVFMLSVLTVHARMLAAMQLKDAQEELAAARAARDDFKKDLDAAKKKLDKAEERLEIAMSKLVPDADKEQIAAADKAVERAERAVADAKDFYVRADDNFKNAAARADTALANVTRLQGLSVCLSACFACLLANLSLRVALAAAATQSNPARELLNRLRKRAVAVLIAYFSCSDALFLRFLMWRSHSWRWLVSARVRWCQLLVLCSS